MRLVYQILLCAIAVNCRTITFNNRCNEPIWIAQLTNNQGPPLDGGTPRLDQSGSFTFNIPDEEWGGRFWPKLRCDDSGENCEVGQSMDPCGPNGCSPPAETKVEFFYPPRGADSNSWYDVSLVDGYSIPAEIVPSNEGGSCVVTRCAIDLNSCPTNENDVGDLRVEQNGQTIMCLSPCKKWTTPAPYGLGNPETDEPGLHLCCPEPPISSPECNAGIVVQTQYVNLVRSNCRNAYSFAFDDEAALHNCPNDTEFVVNFCI